MSRRMAQLRGEPSGFRVRVPLAGMPLKHGIRNSGQVALPSWASMDLPPSEWTLPTPTFVDDLGRQRELAGLLLKLKPIPAVNDASCPRMKRLADSQ